MNIERLRALLEAAVKLELAIIPPYLCGLYSIHPAPTRGHAGDPLVVVEDAAHDPRGNVLNAIGGRPRVSGPATPHYPHSAQRCPRPLPLPPAALESS
jgi:hypothetical protein